MKLKHFSLVSIILSSAYLFSCTATGSVNITPTSSPSSSAMVSPMPTATASATTEQKTFTGTFTGSAEVPAVTTNATGNVTFVINSSTKMGMLTLNFTGLSSDQIGAHIHGPAVMGENAAVLIPLPNGQLNNHQITLTEEQFGFLNAGKLYVNIHSNNFPNGEIRAQLMAQ